MTERNDRPGANYDVIVAGVGSVGSAACYHLARRGAEVLGLEQFEIPHARGSHHGRSRMIRQAYFEHPDYVPLLRRAYQLWDELQASDGREFFHLTGGLYLGAQDGTIVTGSLRAAREHHLHHALLDRAALGERFPALRPAADHVGFFEELGGCLIPELAAAAHADAARQHGATLHTGEAMQSWKAGADRVEITTDRATYRAAQLVITSGAWSAAAAQDLGIPLQVTRQVLAWFKPLGDPARFAPGKFPCWFVESAPPGGHYGFPLLPGDPGLKIGLHQPGEPLGPLAEVKPARADEIEALHAAFEQFFPGCAGELAESSTCKYTMSPDGHFIVGTHPRHPRVSLACGLSGHGFKFSSVLGEALADLAHQGHTDLPIHFLTPTRFGNGGRTRVALT